MKSADVGYPIRYSEDFIKDATLVSCVKLASWLYTKNPDTVLFVPILDSGLVFSRSLLRNLSCTYAVLPIMVKIYDELCKKEIQLTFLECCEPIDISQYRDIVIVDSFCETGHTLKAVRDYVYKPGVDIFTIVLLDRQLPGRVYRPDVSAIQDSRPARWVGCGMDFVDGEGSELPYLIGYRPE